MRREGGGQKCRDAVRRIGVKVVSEKRERWKIQNQYMEGGGDEGGWKRRSWESLSVFLNFSSRLWALVDLHTVPA